MSKELTVSNNLVVAVEEALAPFKEQLAEWKKESELIVVTDALQVDLIKKSAVGRKILSTIRISLEKKRKLMKQESLDYGRFIDKTVGDFSDEVVELEEHYRANEEFAEREELKKQEALKIERMVIIKEKGISEFEIGFNLGTATNKQFEDFIAFKEFEAKKKIEDEEAEKKKREDESKIYEVKAKVNKRTLQIVKLGFFNCDEIPEEFKHKSIEAEFSYHDMLNDTEEEWNQKIADVKGEIKTAEEEFEKECKVRNELITSRRLSFNKFYIPSSKPIPEGFEFLDENPWADFMVEHHKHYEDTQKRLQKEQEAKDKENAQRIKEEFNRKAKEKEEQDKKEAAEKLTQGSDKDKCTELFTLMSGLKFPELRSTKGKTLMRLIHSDYDNMLRQIQEFIDSK
jgi:hypothetical protein